MKTAYDKLLKGCGKMYCAIEHCGRIDESHSAYCSEHGRSSHKICGLDKNLCDQCKAKAPVFIERCRDEFSHLTERRNFNDTRRVIFNEAVVEQDNKILTAKEMLNFENRWLDKRITDLKEVLDSGEEIK